MRPLAADREHSPDLRERAGHDQARSTRRRQVRPIPIPILLLAALGACDVPKEVNPVEIYREVAGINDQRRAPPPGMDRPYRSLGSVPPRPERPPAEAREAISGALAADRAASREPVVARGDAPAADGFAPGELPLPAAPPPRANLAAAPAVPWSTLPRAPGPAPAAAGRPAPPLPPRPAGPAASAEPPAAPAPDMPEAPPPAPPTELLAPPPPSPDLLAPAPPRLR